MTNSDIILNLIRSSQTGFTDSEIRKRTGVEPHQQVNQICRHLAKRGIIRRERDANNRWINRSVFAGPGIAQHRGHCARPALRTQRSHNEPRSTGLPGLDLSKTLFVIPCSGRKRPGGGGADRGESILDCLPSGLADELRMQRERNAPAVELNAARRLPATERYSGYLYEAAGARTFERLDDAGSRIAIISGGYGLVLGYERIGMYDQVFKGAMWPERLIQRCLATCAQVAETRTVVGLLSASTSYAKVFRGARWPAGVAQAFLLSPEPTCGAMVKAPRTQGEALAEIARSGHLLPGWRSSDGLGVAVTDLAVM